MASGDGEPVRPIKKYWPWNSDRLLLVWWAIRSSMPTISFYLYHDIEKKNDFFKVMNYIEFDE